MDKTKFLPMDDKHAWIKSVRGKMSRIEFAKHICHYRNVSRMEDGVKCVREECTPYHRNEIGNWEDGNKLPEDIEGVLSIALLEFDKVFEKEESEITVKDRNERYVHANERMLEFLGKYLYARNLREVLLIQVCRGVISFEEVLFLEEELNELLENEYSLGVAERQNCALQEETIPILDDLLSIQTEEELIECVKQSGAYILTGKRTLGERLRKCFKDRQRYDAEISLQEAVRIYAPNYRDSIQHTFTSKSGRITRQWILDLCVHLRFNREEIQEMLKNAHFISGEKGRLEQFYSEKQEQIGSAKWYQYMEQQYPQEFKGHFAEFRSMSFLKKVMIAVVISTYIENMIEVEEEIVPIDHILESFLLYQYGKNVEKEVRGILETTSLDEELEFELLQEKLTKKMKRWMSYMQSAFCKDESEAYRKVYAAYKQEFSEYFSFSKKAVSKISADEEVVKLRYLAAILYTIFTGKYYEGTVSEEDLKEIEEQIEKEGKDKMPIYFFLKQYFVTFLTNETLYKNKYGEYYILYENNALMSMDMKEVCGNLWESLFLVFHTLPN